MQRWWLLVRRDLDVGLRTRRFLLLAVLFVGFATLAAGAGVLVLDRIEAEIVRAAGIPTNEDGEVDPELRQAIFDEIGEGFEEQTLSRAPALRTSVVSIVGFWMTRAALPLLLLLAFSDIVSGDLRRRTLCYDTTRVSRPAWLAARVAAQAALSWLLIAVTLLLLYAGGSLMLLSWETDDAVAAALSTAARLLPFHLFCVCTIAWASSTTRSATGALLRGAATFGALFLGLFILDAIVDRMELPTALTHVEWLNPGHHAAKLWMADGALAGAIALLAFSAMAFALATRSLQRSNL